MEKIVTYFDTRELSYECETRSGKKHGLERLYYRNGDVFSEGQFENGVRVGRILEWNEVGLLIRSAEYDGGLLNGEYESRWENGLLKERGRFCAGVREVGYTWFGMDGSVRSVLE